MQRSLSLFVLLFLIVVAFVQAAVAQQPAWVEAMREVHSRSTGETGVLMHLGDSITHSMAYFAPLQFLDSSRLPDQLRDYHHRVHGYIQPECYRWKGADKGNDSGKTAAWALEHVDGWIDGLRPEAAVIMFGTNDIRAGSVEDHAQKLRELVQRCLDRGIVVLLSTIPPMHGYEDEVREAVEAQRRIASELNVPLIDLYAHVMNRRATDWDGSAGQFESFAQWEVPTIISRDGVHLSNPAAWRDDYSEEGLRRNGNTLRNFLTVMAYAEIIHVVFQGNDPSSVSREILGSNPPKPSGPKDLESSGQPNATLSHHPPVQDWFPKAPRLPEPQVAMTCTEIMHCW